MSYVDYNKVLRDIHCVDPLPGYIINEDVSIMNMKVKTKYECTECTIIGMC